MVSGLWLVDEFGGGHTTAAFWRADDAKLSAVNVAIGAVMTAPGPYCHCCGCDCHARRQFERSKACALTIKNANCELSLRHTGFATAMTLPTWQSDRVALLDAQSCAVTVFGCERQQNLSSQLHFCSLPLVCATQYH